MKANFLSKAVIVASLLLPLSPLNAADFVPMTFEGAKLESVQKEGKVAVVHFHANWCPVCRKQEKVLGMLLAEPEFKNVVVFKADFDSTKELQRKMNVNGQATLVVFSHGKEVNRSMGAMNELAIREQILAATKM